MAEKTNAEHLESMIANASEAYKALAMALQSLRTHFADLSTADKELITSLLQQTTEGFFSNFELMLSTPLQPYLLASITELANIANRLKQPI